MSRKVVFGDTDCIWGRNATGICVPKRYAVGLWFLKGTRMKGTLNVAEEDAISVICGYPGISSIPMDLFLERQVTITWITSIFRRRS